MARYGLQLLILIAAVHLVGGSHAAGTRPNVVIMLADDMGYGEVQALNPERGKIKTPQLDSIARSGMIFTDAHSGSSVCTPTRYGLMTGRYAWRTRLQSGVLTGGNSLIARERLTIADMMKAQGYHTAIVGKWHLGMLFNGKAEAGKVVVGTKVTDGPIDAGGFDEFHGFHHARQMNLWIDNDQVTQDITPIEMLPKLTETAVNFISGRKGKDEPFFLYVPWNSPHSPVVPAKEWQGRSGLNDHADFVMQTDYGFGQIMKALKDNGFADNTLVICSSDNGTSAPTSDKAKLETMGHFPSGELRGSKADIWDGGHRLPFFVSWPGVVKPGSHTASLTCHTDVMATLADLVGASIPADAAEDSFSFLPVLKGEGSSARKSVVHHSISGNFAIRQDRWKLAVCSGSGGWTAPKSAGPNEPQIQLYDMTADIGEQHNLAESMPEKVKELRALLDKTIVDGRSTDGPAQKNDVAVVVDKRAGGGNAAEDGEDGDVKKGTKPKRNK